MPKRKKTTGGRGGPRPGSGRKQKHRTPSVAVSVSVPQHLADALDSYADRKGIKRSEAAAKAIAILTSTAV